jgi:hypothetical protein
MERVCPGGSVETVDQLKQLRYCTIIRGSLVIHVNDKDADYSALWDIESIQGLLQGHFFAS